MNTPTSRNFRLAAFVARTERLGPAGQREAMRAEIVNRGGRCDLQPDTGDGYHIALFGLQSIGISEDDAYRHWLCSARTLLGGFDAPSQDPDMRLPQLTWAAHILACWKCTPLHHLRSACKIILALSTNRPLRDRAGELARTYNMFPLNLPD